MTTRCLKDRFRIVLRVPLRTGSRNQCERDIVCYLNFTDGVGKDLFLHLRDSSMTRDHYRARMYLLKNDNGGYVLL